MIETSPTTSKKRGGCSPGADCCSSCASHRMGATPDSNSFNDFLAANPDLASQFKADQAANPSDPILQQVMYNPVTGIVGPVPLAYTQNAAALAAPTPTTGNSTTGTNWATLAIAALLALIVLQAIAPEGRRR